MSKSYVISVSFGTGCYRHVQISETADLNALHKAVQNAFGLEGDHAFWFNMDNKAEPTAAPAGTAVLAALDLKKEKKFKYISACQPEHPFQCRVLREEEGETETPTVLRKAGQVPEWFFETETAEPEASAEPVENPAHVEEVRETAPAARPRRSGANVPLMVEMETVRAYQMSRGAFCSFARESAGKVGRNEPCPCGSGKKYKKCCGR